MKARINQAFDRIFDSIQADAEKRRALIPTAHEGSHKTETEKDKSPAGRRTTTTEKPETDALKGEMIDPESVPDASGKNDDGCIYGTDGGPNACTVTVESGDPEPIAMRLFDIDGGTQNDEWSLRTPIPRDPKKLDEMVHCNSDVAKKLSELKGIYLQQRNSSTGPSGGVEHAFTVSRVDGQIRVSDIVTTRQHSQVSYSVNPATVIATFHTHPNGKFPSGSVKEGGGDIGGALNLRFISYVLGPSGLTLFNPSYPITSDNQERKIFAAECPKGPKK